MISKTIKGALSPMKIRKPAPINRMGKVNPIKAIHTPTKKVSMNAPIINANFVEFV